MMDGKSKTKFKENSIPGTPHEKIWYNLFLLQAKQLVSIICLKTMIGKIQFPEPT